VFRTSRFATGFRAGTEKAGRPRAPLCSRFEKPRSGAKGPGLSSDRTLPWTARAVSAIDGAGQVRAGFALANTRVSGRGAYERAAAHSDRLQDAESSRTATEPIDLLRQLPPAHFVLVWNEILGASLRVRSFEIEHRN
jgi:hypothetical protein